ncbi:fumarylacetoacetase, C-terminal-like protein [Aspergillus terreus]|uniref:Fumarylacetoacetase, C-terminal-like protein n=1 Tax=Aspergillus terreus TaxID=33178 RepID=A0A5M3YY07_ASPTE|nr:hypothetical protein ATETN484_0004034500 [Aspergillus terreus]GFF13235.1 fumarylacetoacetase, C-terminal-like protein [Aspergillus terreus]
MGISTEPDNMVNGLAARTHPVWKRWVRFRAKDGNVHGGEPVDADIDVGLALENKTEVSVRLVAGASALDYDAPFTGEVAVIDELLSPVSPEEAGTVRCIGLNYKEHAAEMKMTLPDTPTVFLKANTCISSAAEPIVMPSAVDHDEIDYEVELAIIIGQRCKNVSVAKAMDYVLGYSVANDVTARKHQGKTSQWSYAKGMDGFCPLGPCIVSAERIPDPLVFQLRTSLNGKIMQKASADDMIFSIAEVVSYLSQGHTLLPGTVIITGTPCGIGVSQNPPVFLKPGDRLRISASHGIGTQICPIARDPSPSKSTKMPHHRRFYLYFGPFPQPLADERAYYAQALGMLETGAAVVRERLWLKDHDDHAVMLVEADQGPLDDCLMQMFDVAAAVLAEHLERVDRGEKADLSCQFWVPDNYLEAQVELEH